MERLRNILKTGNASQKCLILTVSLLALMVCNCSSTSAQQAVSHGERPEYRDNAAGYHHPAKASSTEQRLRAKVRQWEGVPHRMGGTGKRGFDCSGFVQRVYRDLFDVRLPRSTALQVKVGSTVARKELRTGDLVFFHPPNKIRHVGIYLNNGEFAHASTKRGVTISQINSPYWRKSYWTAKRVLTHPTS